MVRAAYARKLQWLNRPLIMSCSGSKTQFRYFSPPPIVFSTPELFLETCSVDHHYPFPPSHALCYFKSRSYWRRPGNSIGICLVRACPHPPWRLLVNVTVPLLASCHDRRAPRYYEVDRDSSVAIINARSLACCVEIAIMTIGPTNDLL
jgi:hypothetical protein